MPDPEKTLGRVLLGWLLVMVFAGLFVAGVLAFNGCTPTQQQAATTAHQTTVTSLRIAACVQSVIAEEEQKRLAEQREEEAAAALEAERLRNEPIDTNIRDGGAM